MAFANLTIGVSANSTKFEAGVKKANKAGTRWRKHMQRQSSLVKKAFAGIAGALAVKSIVSNFNSITDSISTTAKEARALDLTMKELQQAQYAFRIQGIDDDTLAKSMRTLLKATKEAQDGVATYADEFKMLNLDPFVLSQKSAIEQVIAVREALEKVDDLSQRTGSALTLFGRGGQKMLQAIIEDLKNRMEEARELDIGLKDTAGNIGEQFDDAREKLFTVLNDAWQKFSIQVMPVLTYKIDKFIEYVQSQGGAVKLLNDIWQTTKQILTAVIAIKVASRLRTVATTLAAAAASLVGAVSWLASIAGSLSVLAGQSSNSTIQKGNSFVQNKSTALRSTPRFTTPQVALGAAALALGAVAGRAIDKGLGKLFGSHDDKFSNTLGNWMFGLTDSSKELDKFNKSLREGTVVGETDKKKESMTLPPTTTESDKEAVKKQTEKTEELKDASDTLKEAQQQNTIIVEQATQTQERLIKTTEALRQEYLKSRGLTDAELAAGTMSRNQLLASDDLSIKDRIAYDRKKGAHVLKQGQGVGELGVMDRLIAGQQALEAMKRGESVSSGKSGDSWYNNKLARARMYDPAGVRASPDKSYKLELSMPNGERSTWYGDRPLSKQSAAQLSDR